MRKEYIRGSNIQATAETDLHPGVQVKNREGKSTAWSSRLHQTPTALAERERERERERKREGERGGEMEGKRNRTGAREILLWLIMIPLH